MSLLPGRQRADHQRARSDRDWYIEPVWAVEAFFDAVKFEAPIHDPCCGEGRIVKAARAAGYEATGSDIADRGFGEPGVDFLLDTTPRTTLVFNPPGKPRGEPNWTDLFIAHALQVASSAIAMIVPVPYLCGQDRRRTLYTPYPPHCVYICSQRPSMPPGGAGIPAKGGTTDYCWIVWRIGQNGPTTTVWLEPIPIPRLRSRATG